jgi:hypothetical protein
MKEKLRGSSVVDFIQGRKLLLGAFVLTAAVVWTSSRDQPLAAGSDITFTFTLVPSDAKGLACSSAQPFEGERCEFDGERASVKVEHALRPYTTTDQELILLGGVFEDPEVLKWLENANEKSDVRRVTVRCDGTFVGRAPTVKVRWTTDGPFGVAEDIRIGRMKKCSVTP